MSGGNDGSIYFEIGEETNGNIAVSGSGAANFEGLDVGLSGGAGVDLTSGDLFKVADGGATLSGVTLDPETAVADKSLYYDFALVDGTYGELGGDDTDLYALVLEKKTIEFAADPGKTRALAAVNTFVSATSDDPGLVVLSGLMNNAASDEELADILEAIMPPKESGAAAAMAAGGGGGQAGYEPCCHGHNRRRRRWSTKRRRWRWIVRRRWIFRWRIRRRRRRRWRWLLWRRRW